MPDPRGQHRLRPKAKTNVLLPPCRLWVAAGPDELRAQLHEIFVAERHTLWTTRIAPRRPPMLDSIPDVLAEIADEVQELRTFAREDVPSNHALGAA